MQLSNRPLIVFTLESCFSIFSISDKTGQNWLKLSKTTFQRRLRTRRSSADLNVDSDDPTSETKLVPESKLEVGPG